MLPEVLPLRHASRQLVRELGFLQGRDAASKMSYSHCHTLIEVDGRGTLAQAELPALLRLDKSTTSRIVAELEGRGLVRAKPSPDDARARILSLTPKGREKLAVVHRDSNARVEEALRLLDEDGRRAVVRGLELYSRALERSRERSRYVLRPIAPKDKAGVARLIRTVMPEFGAVGPGFAINDAEVDDMPAAYAAERSGYWVIVTQTKPETVLGGGGFAPLAGGDPSTCELRKMYFLPELRGLGFGQDILTLAMDGARSAGFATMYLETLRSMSQARALYLRNGFRPLEGRLGSTGHHGCDSQYARALTGDERSGK
jgi:putative acetyltransferase